VEVFLVNLLWNFDFLVDASYNVLQVQHVVEQMRTTNYRSKWSFGFSGRPMTDAEMDALRHAALSLLLLITILITTSCRDRLIFRISRRPSQVTPRDAHCPKQQSFIASRKCS